MTEQFQFLHKFFHKSVLEDSKDNVRVEVTETPSFDIHEEEYSLRIKMRRLEENRTTAIEHHPHQQAHRQPHLQFKLHCDGVGTIHLTLQIETEEEYHNAVLGFIYKLKSILGTLEDSRPGITEEILKIEKVNELADKGRFLETKVKESLASVAISGQSPRSNIQNLRTNPLLINFMGETTVEQVVARLEKKKEER